MMVIGDATGIGHVMCDLIRRSGIPIVDFNFGGSSADKAYKNEGARIWYQVAKMIRDSKIVAPDRYKEETKKLCAQLSSRQQKSDTQGKMWMESKEDMRARGVSSPDIADAFAMAFALQPAMSYSTLPYDDSGRQEIARRQGWEYTSDTPDYDESYADRRTWNQPGRNDDNPGSGGVHSIWLWAIAFFLTFGLTLAATPVFA
jgi:hypothetical protein